MPQLPRDDPFAPKPASGLTDARGRPLRPVEVERQLVAGVLHAMAFVLMPDDTVIICQMSPEDVWAADTMPADGTPGVPAQELHLRVKPGWHQLGEPWDGIPGTAALIIDGYRKALAEHLENMTEFEADVAGEPDDPDGTADPSAAVGS